ncbi:dihydrofolate reductase [Croceimicrobium hydrocarbonivorans]|uniref:Dihydrofolate reductase n=1 Tax=Croceimicrobium hydrocarbonivorans TaxID=2761580 RepID=A0A7H0VBG3_9FLAO|nr:dihydrofolate reductase [Croceimicrobium hydrocarbonivorans]QNR23061.1 dihydrofolate reductase [Croceimicrobium hydrocarbonivorans]
MNLTLIAAMAQNRVIGKDNDLIWHFPEDLKRFKKLTSGHAIIMGRKTYESLGRPLPNRKNIVITRQADYKAEGCLMASNMESAIELAKEDNQPFIVGGAEIYKQALPFAKTIELTLIKADYEGDTYFPEFDPEVWKLARGEKKEADDKHAHPFEFQTYKKIKL